MLWFFLLVSLYCSVIGGAGRTDEKVILSLFMFETVIFKRFNFDLWKKKQFINVNNFITSCSFWHYLSLKIQKNFELVPILVPISQDWIQRWFSWIICQWIRPEDFIFLSREIESPKGIYLKTCFNSSLLTLNFELTKKKIGLFLIALNRRN